MINILCVEWRSKAGPVIKATGRTEFEDGLKTYSSRKLSKNRQSKLPQPFLVLHDGVGETYRTGLPLKIGLASLLTPDINTT